MGDSNSDNGPITPKEAEAAKRAYQKAVAQQQLCGAAGYAANDPWQHRSEGMRCKTCIWFVRKQTIQLQQSSNGAIGRCRRHAPTMSGFPVVFEMDWCGDHKLREDI